MEELLKQLSEVLEEINNKIESTNGATERDMETFRTKTFDIQNKMYKISQHHYTEDLCKNIRTSVYFKWNYWKL